MESGGNRRRARALIDSGAAISFITSRLVNSLRAKRISSVTAIACFQQTSAPASRFKLDLNLKSMQDPTAPVISTRAAVVDTIAGNLTDTTLAGVKDLDFL